MNEEDVASGLLDSLAQVEEVLSLLLEDLVHLSVVVDDDLVVHLLVRCRLNEQVVQVATHVGLGRRQLELDETYSGLLNSSRSSCVRHDGLVQRQSLDELGVLDGASDFLDNPDISQINVGRGRVDKSGDSGDGDRSESGRVLGDNLKVRSEYADTTGDVPWSSARFQRLGGGSLGHSSR
mgnify:CR=1 FL=1